MANWVTGKVVKVQNWTDALFSLTVHAPVAPFTAGQFAKLGLDVDGERVQRAYSYVNAPGNPDLEFYLVTVPEGKLSPRLAALKPGDEVQVVSEAAGFFVLEEVPDCDTLWMLATGTAIGPYLSILEEGKDLDRFKTWYWCTPRAMPPTSAICRRCRRWKRAMRANCASSRSSAGKPRRACSRGASRS
jgi:ferredoxin--NADP+ reductase